MICGAIVDEVLGGTDKLLLHFDNIGFCPYPFFICFITACFCDVLNSTF